MPYRPYAEREPFTDKHLDVNNEIKTMKEILNGTEVFIKDQTSQPIELHFTKEVQLATLVNPTIIDDELLTVTTGIKPVVGNMICLREGTNNYQGEILTSVANTTNWDITVDAPLDAAYTTGAVAAEELFNLNVDGSSTRQLFKVTPVGLQAGLKFDITRIIFSITDATSMDDALFGGLDALAKGVLLRSKNGTTKNLFIAKTNGDLKSHMYDVQYSDKAPAGFFGISGRKTWAGQSKSGVALRIGVDTADELQMIIQDDLQGLNTFHVLAMGHVVEDLI